MAKTFWKLFRRVTFIYKDQGHRKCILFCKGLTKSRTFRKKILRIPSWNYLRYIMSRSTEYYKIGSMDWFYYILYNEINKSENLSPFWDCVSILFQFQMICNSFRTVLPKTCNSEYVIFYILSILYYEERQ